jgi:hypothetical protein
MARLFSELLDTITIIISISMNPCLATQVKGISLNGTHALVLPSLLQGVSDDFFSC